ncbi:vesicular transport factor Uso1p [Campylobacter concisus]|uniref:vesicular transport factor Uso1p n=1 Tax=Campylobacter concisus TaxID=199 RepID=UPI00130E12F4|nr:vesicular transport factor Uso1p [Campylobacter concisus]
MINKILLAIFCLIAGFCLSFFKSPKEDETPKDTNQTIYSINFDNLPEEERQKYISKDDLYEYGGYITPKSYIQNFTETNDQNLSNDVNELQEQVRELSKKNKILATDNVDISEKNLDFISKISEMKKNIENEKNEIVEKNQKTLGELEAQHFENIQTLTKRLNEAQVDMIESSKAYEKKIVDLENAINEAKNGDESKVKDIEANFAKFKEAAEANYTALKEQNIELNTTLAQKDALIKEYENTQNEKDKNEKREILLLKEEIERAKNDAKTQKFSYEKEINALTDGFETQKSVMEDELSKKANKIIDLEEALESSKTALKDRIYELDEIKKNLNSKDLAVENYNGKNLELNASLAALHKSFNDLKEKNLKSEQENKLANENINSLKKELERINLINKKLEKQNLDANASLSELNKKLNLSEESLKNARDELKTLDTKTNKFLKTLFEQNQTISLQTQKLGLNDSELKNLSAKINSKDEKIKELENNLTQTSQMLAAKQSELEAQKRTLKIDMQNYEILRQQINILQKKIADTSALFADSNKSSGKNLLSLQNELESAKHKLNENNKTIERLNSKINELSSSSVKGSPVNAKIIELQKDIEQNLNRQDELENENVNLKNILQATTKPETPTKLVLISSLECDDMDAKDKISVMCKNRVSEFLQRFNSNYLYEIIPIVDKKNFVIPSNVAQSIKKDDLGRLNNYVNYGVGKERAKAAAELIKEEFGDFARISFSSEVIVKDVTRGFIIKVYR